MDMEIYGVVIKESLLFWNVFLDGIFKMFPKSDCRCFIS